MAAHYFKICDRCGTRSDELDRPDPAGWVTLADAMHGTLACVDYCPACLEETDLAPSIQRNILDRMMRARQLAETAQLEIELVTPAYEALIEEQERDSTIAEGELVDEGTDAR